MSTDNTIAVTNLRTIQAERPGSYLVAAEEYGSQPRLYGPFATKQEAQDFGQDSFGGLDFTGGVRWMVYEIDSAIDQFLGG